MLTADGCRTRRGRFLERIRPTQPLLLGDPIHLRYLANFHVDPFSLGADYRGLLLLTPDGHAKLFHDNRLPASVKQAHVDETEVINWYDGVTPGRGPRRLALLNTVKQHGGHIHDDLASPMAQPIIEALGDLRRAKIPTRSRCSKSAWPRQTQDMLGREKTCMRV